MFLPKRWHLPIHGLAVSLLPTWYDVDTIADLHQLNSEITKLSNKAGAAARNDS
jgi:hypothetical protein